MLSPRNEAVDSSAPSLNSLYFYLTSYCNLKCLHCWIDPMYIDKEEAQEEASFELLKDVIDQAIPLGLKSIKITGGEPFLNKNIFSLIAYAFKKRLIATIETNGTLINDNIASFLKKNNVKQIAVSIDGHNKIVHERLRGVGGSFEKAVNGIKVLKKYNLNIQIIMAVYKDNIGHVEDVIKLAESLGVSNLKINRILNISRGEDLNAKDKTLSVSSYIRFNKMIDTDIQPSYRLNIMLDIPLAFKKIWRIRETRSMCNIKNIAGVLADGSISMCGIGRTIESLKLGSIRQESLRHIWTNNPTLRIIREGLPDGLKGICGRCIFKGVCMGQCRAEAYYRNNDLLSPFSFCEEAFKLGLFPKHSMFNKTLL
ncbi:MAG: radical SAM protein [Candidatus Omnitrophota bacterium]|nr:radical SAM protein [Candidatus Omnitrophota bacterium]